MIFFLKFKILVLIVIFWICFLFFLKNKKFKMQIRFDFFSISNLFSFWMLDEFQKNDVDIDDYFISFNCYDSSIVCRYCFCGLIHRQSISRQFNCWIFEIYSSHKWNSCNLWIYFPKRLFRFNLHSIQNLFSICMWSWISSNNCDIFRYLLVFYDLEFK